MSRFESQGKGRRERCNLPHRYLLTAMACLSSVPAFGVWTVFGQVMVHVTSPADVTSADVTSADCLASNTSGDLHLAMGEDTLFYVHTVYLVVHLTMKVPGGVLAARFSAVKVLGWSMLVLSGTFLLLPVVLVTNIQWMIFLLRALHGALDGSRTLIACSLISAWATDWDRTTLLAIYYTGTTVTPGILNLLTGFALCYLDWSLMIYFVGVYGILWACVWMTQVYDNPCQHPHLSQKERCLYKLHTKQSDSHADEKLGHSGIQPAIPWRGILASPTVWALFLICACKNYMFAQLIVGFPQYFSDVFHLDPASNGLFSTLPHLGGAVTCLLGGAMCNVLIRRKFSLTFSRKFTICLGFGTEALCMVSLFFVTDLRLAVLACAGTSLGGIGNAVYPAMYHDLAPRFVAVLASLVQMGNVGALVATIQSAFMPGQDNSVGQWQRLFLMGGLAQLALTLFFAAVAKSERQPWAQGDVIVSSPTRQNPTSRHHSSDDVTDEEIDVGDDASRRLLAS